MPDLDELERLLAAMTPEPWHVSEGAIIQTKHITRDVWQIPRVEGDLAGIVALRNTAPALLRELRALREVERRVRELGDHYPDLDDAPGGAVPAWDLVALALAKAQEARDG
jgi:hypothetical protein